MEKTNKNWMCSVNDSTLISNLSIPGTHNSRAVQNYIICNNIRIYLFLFFTFCITSGLFSQINSYTISFDSQGGTYVDPIDIPFIVTEIIPPADPTKTDLTFAGWYTDTSCTNRWSFTNMQINRDTTLYAKWTADVDFNSQGGSPTPATILGVQEGQKISQPANPDKANVTFGGWYTDDLYTTQWDFGSDAVTKNMTLHAKWIATVTFDTQGGSTISPETSDLNNTITQPSPDPAKDGCTFGGWYKDALCTTVWDFATDQVTQDTTLYAKWDITYYTITLPVPDNFLINGAASEIITKPDTTIMYGSAFVFKIEPEAGYGQSTPVIKAGSTQLTADGFGYYHINPVTQDSVITVTGIELNKYTVSFDSQGGSIVNPINVDHGLEATEPPTPTLTGHAFEGWYTNTSYTTRWNFPSSQVTQDTTLYAKWDINLYTITLPVNPTGYSIVKPDGSVFLPADLTVRYGDNFDFMVKLNPDYHLTTPVVNANNSLLTADPNGVYTIPNIQENKDVQVEGIKQNLLLQIVPKTNCTIIPGELLQVKEGGDVQFTVKRSPGFEDYIIELTVDDPDKCGAIAINQSTGLCTIQNMQADVAITITYKGENAVYPIIHRKVELHACDGLILTPQPGIRYIASGSNFSFTYYVKEGYDAENLKITTGDLSYDDSHIRITPQSDGGFLVTIYAIRREININITGVRPTNSVGNDTFTDKKDTDVWAYGQTLYIRTTQTTEMAIYDAKGVLYKKETLPVGLQSYQLRNGIYFVVTGNRPAQKVVIH